MTTTENEMGCNFINWCDIYLLEMTATGNLKVAKNQKLIGIYLLEMTTTENEYIKGEATHVGIYLLEMTTIENNMSA